MNKTEVKTIIDNLSSLIYSTMKELAAEQKYPGMDPDQMDDNLKILKERYYRLVKIRFDIEITCADVTLTNVIIGQGDIK